MRTITCSECGKKGAPLDRFVSFEVVGDFSETLWMCAECDERLTGFKFEERLQQERDMFVRKGSKPS
jgi:hypothetical protein